MEKTYVIVTNTLCALGCDNDTFCDAHEISQTVVFVPPAQNDLSIKLKPPSEWPLSLLTSNVHLSICLDRIDPSSESFVLRLGVLETCM